MIEDPVCGTQLDPDEAEFTSEYRGQTYYFESETCKAEFDADPGAFSGHNVSEDYGDLPYKAPPGASS
jgi:YHS domain-containing protein